MTRRSRLFAALLSGAAALALAMTSPQAAVESTDPIKITLNDWTGQSISAHLLGAVLEKAGYNVEYVQADYLAQFAGLETGDLHVATELWATTAAEALEKSVATGNTENFGETGMQAIEEWWYPLYMKEQCPGLPDWKALRDCAEVFSTPETAPLGRYVGGPSTWGGYDDERVEALDLGFEVVHSGTDAALFAELESAYQRKAPVILWVYSPHWAPAKFEGEFVEFPPYAPECYTDPSWGENPDLAYDCGKPRGPVWKAGWAGLKDKWPGAYAIIKAFTLTNDEMNQMVVEADLEGKPVDQVVADWMAANEAKWKSWIGQ
jgi:glycine betaine/proline transport system substrate-binding protein